MRNRKPRYSLVVRQFGQELCRLPLSWKRSGRISRQDRERVQEHMAGRGRPGYYDLELQNRRGEILDHEIGII